jgi:hypothetical protein
VKGIAFFKTMKVKMKQYVASVGGKIPFAPNIMKCSKRSKIYFFAGYRSQLRLEKYKQIW